jgi:hypothetical protein
MVTDIVETKAVPVLRDRILKVLIEQAADVKIINSILQQYRIYE